MIVLFSRIWRIINLPTENSTKECLSSSVRIIAIFPWMGEVGRMTLSFSVFNILDPLEFTKMELLCISLLFPLLCTQLIA